MELRFSYLEYLAYHFKRKCFFFHDSLHEAFLQSVKVTCIKYTMGLGMGFEGFDYCEYAEHTQAFLQ